MDDFGNDIMDFYNARSRGSYGFAAFHLCSEGSLAGVFGDDMLRWLGVIA